YISICSLLIYSFSTLMSLFPVFFFIITSSTEIYTLSYTTLFRSIEIAALGVVKPDRLDNRAQFALDVEGLLQHCLDRLRPQLKGDRKSTRLNSSHVSISYAVFCLKKKKKRYNTIYNNRDR